MGYGRGTTMTVLIVSINEEPTKVTLSDGHDYLVLGRDVSRVAIWYETQRIPIEENEDGDGVLLRNLDTSEPDTPVRATRL